MRMNAVRAALLREMGLTPLWRPREAPPLVLREAAAPRPAKTQTAPAAPQPSARVRSSEPAKSAQPARVLIPVTAPAAPQRAAPPPAAAADGEEMRARAERIAQLDWDELDAEIRACRACGLCQERRQAVPGVGERTADWLFVGEGPGREEDERGEPFVGRSGKLLDKMLAAIGLRRGEDVYIANAVKCRPPYNRTPEEAEIALCRPFLARQIALLQPRLIVALGRPAVLSLLGENLPIRANRKQFFPPQRVLGGVAPMLISYHPSYLLRNELDKARAWEDLCLARERMAKEKGAVK